jgi:quinol monooxygenase YgiN
MIVVTALAQTDDARRAQAIEVAQTLAAASRAEAGNIGYRICQDTEDPNTIVFVEEWRDEEALQSHFTTPHIATFRAAVAGLVTGPPDVKFHTIAQTRDLSEVGAR